MTRFYDRFVARIAPWFGLNPIQMHFWVALFTALLGFAILVPAVIYVKPDPPFWPTGLGFAISAWGLLIFLRWSREVDKQSGDET